MQKSYIITDKSGRPLRHGVLSEPEARMVAKAGFRVFEQPAGSGQALGSELTPGLTGLFEHKPGSYS